MKIITIAPVLAVTMLLAACASPPHLSAPSATAPSSAASPAAPAAPSSLKTLTHEDLQAAAAYATAHGYPARAAMWQAIETQLTAAENLVAACKAAIAGALPAPSTAGPVGVFTLVEVGAEAVAQGVPASVKANCEPIVVPTGLLPIPRP